MAEFKDKIVLISGTGGRMGRIAAQRFAREGAKILGCDVAIQRSEETCRLVRGRVVRFFRWNSRQTRCHLQRLMNKAFRWRHAALGRLALAGEIVETALFLASDRAAYITGTDIAVDGGMSSIIWESEA